MTYTGEECPTCFSAAVDEYCGMCPDCWLQLTPLERTVLRGEKEPPEKEIVTRREEVHHYHRRSRLLAAMLWLWGAAVTAGLAWVLYRGR